MNPLRATTRGISSRWSQFEPHRSALRFRFSAIVAAESRSEEQAARSRMNNERINSHQANAADGLFMRGTDVLFQPAFFYLGLFIILLKIES